jgi:hypothetical protein
MFLDETGQLWIDVRELTAQEPYTCGDRLQRQHRDPVFDRGGLGSDGALDQCQLGGQRTAAQGRPELFGCYHDEALEFVDGLGAADKHCLPGRRQGPDCFAQPADAGTGLMFPCQCCSGGADRVEPVALGSSGAFEGSDFDDILTGQGQFPGKSGSEASRSFQRPDASARGVFPCPFQHACVARTVGCCLYVGTDAAGGCIQHRQVDGVAVRITSDDVVIVLCQPAHCGGPFSQLTNTVKAGP